MGKSKVTRKEKNSAVGEGDDSGAVNSKKKGQAAAKTSEPKVIVEDIALPEQKPETASDEGTSEIVEDQTEQPKKKAKVTKAKSAAAAKDPKESAGALKAKDQKSKTAASAPKRSSLDQVVAEAKAAFGSLDTSEGRTLRKRPGAVQPKSSPKKVAKKTAKDGKEVRKVGRSKKAD